MSINSRILSILAAPIDEPASPTDFEQRFASLVEELHEPLCRYLFLISSNAATSEEIAQESFLRLHRELLAGQEIRSPKPWLFRVARNLVMDSARQMRDEVSLTNDHVARHVDQQYAPSMPSPEEILLRRERMRRLGLAVRALPSQQRHCLYLRREGFRYREIAAILGMGESTVADHIRRAASRLASELDETRDK
jgi:RNA polymerase sigma-70 factor (ECF subfamily)